MGHSAKGSVQTEIYKVSENPENRVGFAVSLHLVSSFSAGFGLESCRKEKRRGH